MINSVASPYSASAASSTGSNASQKTGTDALSQKDTFLKLLVAQMQYQDPMNPMDGTQYMSQLTSYSQLEQLMGIKSGIDDLVTKAGSLDDTTSKTATA